MTELKYSIIYSRRGTIGITISPRKGVTVRAPYRTSLKTIDDFVRDKSPWIEKHSTRLSGLIRIGRKQYVNGDNICYLGRNLRLKVIADSYPFIRINDDYLEFGINKSIDVSQVSIDLEGWFRDQARQKLSERLQNIILNNQQYGFRPMGLAVRSLRSRWGSCSSKGRITLNTNLVKLGENYIDYVIIHELCHLKHHNHGKEFYKLLEKIVPDYRSLRKNLKNYLMG